MTITSKHIALNRDSFEKFRLKQHRGLTTGFREIDSNIIGLPALTNIMGDTGCGKSTFVLNILLHNARQGIPIILVDKENGLQRTSLRLLCLMAGLTTGAIESGNWQNTEETKYREAWSELKTVPIYYLDNLQYDELDNLINETGKLHKKQVLVVIDSLNRIVKGGESKKNEIDEWMTLFNNIKIKYDNYVTFLIICEKSKAQYGGASSKGAKDSGEIDYISELTLDMYPTKDKTATVVECIKNRDGPKGVLTVLEPSKPFTYKVNDITFLPDENIQ